MFRGSDAVAQGLLTRAQLRDPRLRRLLRDVYAPRSVPLDHALRCRGAALVLPASARLTGRSLATVLGTPLRGPADPVEAVVPVADAGPGPRGVLLRAASRGPLGAGTWHGVRVASPERMALDLCATFALETAVGHLDQVAAAGLVDLDRFRTWLVDRHEDGVVLAREAVQLADPAAASPPESVCRVRLRRAGFDVVPQVVVRDAKGFVARVDLAILALKIAIEYDGAWHAALEGQLARDRERLNRLRAAGWLVIHVTADMLRQHGALEDAVQRAVAERAAA